MKETGIVRKLDQLGRITLPIELRRTLKIKESDPVEIFVDHETICIKAYKPVGKLQCVCCGNTDETKLVEKNGVLVCPKCVNDLRQEVMKNE